MHMMLGPAEAITIWFVTMFAGVSSVGLPLGVPPLPEDPVLAQVAPQECLWYFSSAGMATPDPGSSNQTEQLFAEPELQQLVVGIEEQILRAIRREARGREERILATEIPKLVKTALTRPLAVYVSEVRPPGLGGPPTVRAGLICNLGDQADSIERALQALSNLVPGAEAARGGVSDDVKWRVAPLPPDAPPVQWTVHKGYLIIGAGAEEGAAILDRMAAAGGVPDWLQAIRSDLAPERVSTIGYLNVAGLVETFGPMLGENQEALSYLGLDHVETLVSASGLDDTACVSRVKIAIDGDPRGILNLIPQAPLAKRDLALIPHDATAAVAVRLDAKRTLEQILDIVEKFEPSARDEFEDGLWEFEQETGVDIRTDLLATLDDVGIIYMPGGELVSSWIGATAVIKIKDRKRLEGGIKKFIARLEMEFSRGSRRGGTVVRETEYEGQTIHFFSIPEDEMPFAPAWCITDEHLVVGLLPQTIKSFLARADGEKSLADVPQVADALAAGDGPACVSYVDMERLVRGVYPLLQIGARMVCVELRREGIDVDISLLPSIDAIAQHCVPGISTWAKTGDGFLFETRQSLPGGGNVVGMAPVLAAMLVPAVSSARFAAWDVQETNNLRQLALAFHNYADAHNRLPANTYDDDGKPLLSWRVQLLPYIEEAILYDEFRLDEPWDSEHNKELIERMPPWLASPGRPAAPGKTRYVALAGKETIFPGDEKLSFRHVTDGLSKTIIFVRAEPQSAVFWTKPEDIAFDPKNPKNGLDSPKGFFLAALGDGSVQRLSLGLSDETIKNLATRADGEAIDWEDLQRPPQPPRRRPAVPVER